MRDATRDGVGGGDLREAGPLEHAAGAHERHRLVHPLVTVVHRVAFDGRRPKGPRVLDGAVSSRTFSARSVPVSARFSFELNLQDRHQHIDDSGFFGADIVARSSKSWAGFTSIAIWPPAHLVPSTGQS